MNIDSYEDDSKPMICFCQGMCPHGIEYGSCETKPGGKCFTSVELEIGDDGKEHPVLFYGCLPPNEMALFQCGSTLVANRDRKNIKCCDEYDFCNKHLLPIVEKTDSPEIEYFHGMTVTVLLCSMTVCLVVFIAVLILSSLKIKRELKERKKAAEQDIELPVIQVSNNEITVLPQKEEENDIEAITDGNDSDIRSELVQRTIAKQIAFELMIATGKYSEVWKAKWRGETVAVKLYRKDEQNWLREIELFQTPLLRHEHILGYIAADSKDNGPNSEKYIITEYHSYGSLRSYLTQHTVSTQELFQMIKGLASALNHLHTEIIGSNKKPCIAHNNINSTNILVKKDKECCFSDLTKAVRFTSSLNQLDVPNNIENAEIRYLAPEFLNKNFNSSSIDSFKMGDIYSFALIIWEIFSRCETAIPYQLPFEEELAANNLECCLENMAELVANKKIRPQIRSEWQQNSILSVIMKIMMESWSATPSVRLTCLRIKKTIFKIQTDNSG